MMLTEKPHFTDKVLFIVHLAIGDFTYMQNCFYQLKKAYPELKIDLFIQDVRMTEDETKWESLKNYILYEWLETTGLFNQLYYAYSPQVYAASIEACKKAHYPYVISLGDMRSQNYSRLAREIAQDKVAIGIDIDTHIFSFADKKALKTLDFRIKNLNDKSAHISEKFAFWFQQLADLKLDQEARYPFINIPEQFNQEAIGFLASKGWKTAEPVVFINIFAKGEERCWTLEEAKKLIDLLQTRVDYKDAIFLLNTLPEDQPKLEAFIATNTLKNTFTFSATKSFFELPAILKQCSLIVTVDTSIMHLATFSEAKLISLLRRSRRKPSPRWLPLKKGENTILYSESLGAPISSISAESVVLHI